MADDEAVAQAVQFVGGHAWHHVGGDEIQRLGGQLARLAHAFERRRIVDFDLAIFVIPLVRDVFFLHLGAWNFAHRALVSSWDRYG
jgi:hypothetical protein